MLYLYLIFGFFLLTLIGIACFFIYFNQKRIKYYEAHKATNLQVNNHQQNELNANAKYDPNKTYLENQEKNGDTEKIAFSTPKGFQDLLNLAQAQKQNDILQANRFKIDFELDFPVAYHINQIYSLIQSTPQHFSGMHFTHAQKSLEDIFQHPKNPQNPTLEQGQLLTEIHISSYFFKNIKMQALPFQNQKHFAFNLNAEEPMNFLEFSKRVQYAQRLGILLDANLEIPPMHEMVEKADYLAKIYPWSMQSVHYRLQFKHPTPLYGLIRTFALLEDIFIEQKTGHYRWMYDLQIKESKSVINTDDKPSPLLIVYLVSIDHDQALFYFVIPIDLQDIALIQNSLYFNGLKSFEDINLINNIENIENIEDVNSVDVDNHSSKANAAHLKISEDRLNELNQVQNLQTIIQEIEWVMMPFEIISHPIFYQKHSQYPLWTHILQNTLREIFQQFDGQIYHHSFAPNLSLQAQKQANLSQFKENEAIKNDALNSNSNSNSNSNIKLNPMEELIHLNLKTQEKILVNQAILIRQSHEYLKKYHADWLTFIIEQKWLLEKYHPLQYQEDAWWQILQIARKEKNNHEENDTPFEHIKLHADFFNLYQSLQYLRLMNTF